MQTGTIAPPVQMESLVDWVTKSDLALLHNPKDAPSFFSGRWNTGTNPDLAFASNGHVCWQLDRCILEKFPGSQHRPSLIKSSKTVVSLPSNIYKRWNFRKAKWKKCTRITNRLARNLPSPDTTCVNEAYQDFCNIIIHVVKKSIPRGRRKNYRPCWDAECEALYQAFLRTPQGEGSNTAASALLARLDKRRRKRWSEAVHAIDLTHTTRLTWNAINNLTGRTRQSYRSCLISANSIASQLVKNGTYKTNDREFLSHFCQLNCFAACKEWGI